MNSALASVKRIVYDKCNYAFTGFLEEKESREYDACMFKLNNSPVKFRSAKITPTKTGQFVTLWKRNEAGITQPHAVSDEVDLYVISVQKEKFFGQFVFPKSILLKQGILSGPEKEGKRGFRVYPSWDRPENKQALKTQKWQLEFFLEINDKDLPDLQRIKLLYSKK